MRVSHVQNFPPLSRYFDGSGLMRKATVRGLRFPEYQVSRARGVRLITASLSFLSYRICGPQLWNILARDSVSQGGRQVLSG